MCWDLDIIMKSLEKNPDLEKTRNLLRQADGCASCPEQGQSADEAHECSCRFRFRTELQRRLKSDFGIS